MKNIITFETFRNLFDGSYWIDQIKTENPSNINYLSYRKFKVTIELIDEPKEVLIERLESLKQLGSYTKNNRINKEIQRLNLI